MQAVEILLVGTKYVCGICSLMSPDKNEILVHEADWPNLEKPEIFPDQEVGIYRLAYSDGGRPIGVVNEPEKWAVHQLWYSQGGENLNGFVQARQHQLCVELIKYLDPEKRGKALIRMTYSELLLRIRGDREEFERAGLISPVAEKLSLRQKIAKIIG